MLQVLQAFGGPGRTALSFDPTYSMYPEYARHTHTRWVAGERVADFTVDPAQATALIKAIEPSVVLLASPNNPTGTALPLDTIRAVLATAPGVVVVDEAYAEFRRAGTPTALELLAEHPRLLVTRTMSKAFAAAGVRLGYVAAATAVIDALRVVRLPYHLSALTQAAATALLGQAPALLAQVDALRDERDRLAAWLQTRGLQVADSDANFVLFGCFTDRHRVWRGLLDRGVLIRETGPSGWLRVSIGTPAETAAFTHALTEVLDR
jgi:histidinol-phosphate aminotransferase